MDIYSRKSRWKIYLAATGILIVAASAFFTNFLVKKLRIEEDKKAEQLLFAYENLSDPNMDSNCDFTFHQKILENNSTIPIILVNSKGTIDIAKNFGEVQDNDMAYLEKELANIKANGGRPKVVESNVGRIYIYYKYSNILNLLTLFPIIQFLLIAGFIAFGYLTFSNARMAEQNQVWVGMAKETAHQLGTPITAIVAWIEHLRMGAADPDTHEILDELGNDVKRLELVADRFSKIGSAPELTHTNLYEALERCRVYMQRRAPRKVSFDFPTVGDNQIMVMLNAHLFDWVIENILRNALDAMDGVGNISAIIYSDGKYACIDISDTGKGIPANKFKTVFQPGYTTKKRGWGLGLSLAKRIIVSYHKGKILVKKSVPNECTTFCVKLPLAKMSNPE